MSNLTAMQMLIDYMDSCPEKHRGAYGVATELLEVEKQQIIEAYEAGSQDDFGFDGKYYLLTKIMNKQ